MKRTILATIVVALLATTVALAPSASAHGRRWKHCRYGSLELGQTWTHTEVHRTIRCALSHWPASGGFAYADYIADRESGDGANALNPSSGTCGIYQSLPGTAWLGRVRWFRHVSGWHADPSCFNARSSILWAIRYAHQYGWGPWAL